VLFFGFLFLVWLWFLLLSFVTLFVDDDFCWFSFYDIFASWIIGTTVKDTKASALFGHFTHAA